MIIYVVVAVCLILDLINPRILWHMDFWKYNGDKPEPSSTYLLINRILAGIALLIMIGVLFTKRIW